MPHTPVSQPPDPTSDLIRPLPPQPVTEETDAERQRRAQPLSAAMLLDYAAGKPAT